jgi:hypothetical protein
MSTSSAWLRSSPPVVLSSSTATAATARLRPPLERAIAITHMYDDDLIAVHGKVTPPSSTRYSRTFYSENITHVSVMHVNDNTHNVSSRIFSTYYECNGV